MSFGENLKQLRKIYNLTQVELGKKLNVAQVTVSSWENGTKLPEITTIVKIIKLFDTTFEELFEDLFKK